MSPQDPADFASLLEREPYTDPLTNVERIELLEIRAQAVHQSLDYERKLLDLAVAHAGTMTAERDLARKTSESQAERIKELEGVLVAIRSRAVEGIKMLANPGATAAMRKTKLDGIASLVSETLDSCKPWCSSPEDHEGACPPREYSAREVEDE